MEPRPAGWLGWAVFGWAIGGSVLLLVQAISRLVPFAVDAFDEELGLVHYAVAVAWSAFMVYAESWRGFHQRFVPRAVVRSLVIAARPTLLGAALAPLVAMGLVDATPRRLRASWLLVLGIVVLVVLIRQLPQPWRGIVDLGVVLGLAGGTLSFGVLTVAALAGRTPAISADFPPAR